ncbi:MAG: hypothetical protein WCN81_12795 [Actinomycetes bacterium]
MAAGQVPRDDARELAVTLKALEDGYVVLIVGADSVYTHVVLELVRGRSAAPQSAEPAGS